MPEKEKRLVLPVDAETMVMVLKVQEELAAEVGFKPTRSDVVRHLLSLGFAARTRNNVSLVLSTN